MLMFSWYFELGAWSRFWRCLIKICVKTCDKQNSTLGSVVPLAMFSLQGLPKINKSCLWWSINVLFSFITGTPQNKNWKSLLPFGVMTRRLFCWYSDLKIWSQKCPKNSFGLLRQISHPIQTIFIWAPCSMHYVLPEIWPHVVFHECLFQTNQKVAIIHRRQVTPPCMRLGVKICLGYFLWVKSNIIKWKINKRFSGPTQRSKNRVND